jgi:hypothetical protein
MSYKKESISVPPWTSLDDISREASLAGPPDFRISRMAWELRNCSENEIAEIRSKFINDKFQQSSSIMDIVSRIINLGEDLHNSRFSEGEKEFALSFQSDTWKRAQKVMKQDEESSKDPKEQYDYGIRSVVEIDPPSAFEDVIHSVLEGGFEVSVEDDEPEIIEARSRMGVFRVDFWNGDGLILIRVPTAVTDGVVSQNVVVGNTEDLERWAKIWVSRRENDTDFAPGVYVGRVSQRGLSIEEKEVPDVPAVHPKAEKVKEEANRFFENVDQFLRHGRYGMRTIMLQGPPGTGKTTIANEIARNMSDDAISVFANDANTMYKVQHNAADEEVPAIIVVEDAEQAINVSATGGDAGDVAGANSEILNMLDGHNCARNPKGCLIFLLTNRPTEIEGRIRDRPGRVDSIYTIGPIEDSDMAVRCAEIYLPDSHSVSEEEMRDSLEGLSGAEIMTVCDKSAAVAASRGEDLTDEILSEMVEELSDQLTASQKYQDYESSLKEDEGGNYFNPQGS